MRYLYQNSYNIAAHRRVHFFFLVIHCSQYNIHVVCHPNLEPLKYISLGHDYRILVVLLPKKKILHRSQITAHRSLLTARKIALPGCTVNILCALSYIYFQYLWVLAVPPIPLMLLKLFSFCIKRYWWCRQYPWALIIGLNFVPRELLTVVLIHLHFQKCFLFRIQGCWRCHQ